MYVAEKCMSCHCELYQFCYVSEGNNLQLLI